jgi:Heterodisulfide reductase, subunit A and related polyferredoxins
MDDIKERKIVHSELLLGPKSSIYVTSMQAVPNKPVINPETCIHFRTGKCGICSQVCEREAIDYEMKEEEIEVEVGNILLAPGFHPFNPEAMAQFGYGTLPNVLTSLELNGSTVLPGLRVEKSFWKMVKNQKQLPCFIVWEAEMKTSTNTVPGSVVCTPSNLPT